MRDPELLRRRAANGSLPNLVIAGLTPSAMCRPHPHTYVQTSLHGVVVIVAIGSM